MTYTHIKPIPLLAMAIVLLFLSAAVSLSSSYPFLEFFSTYIFSDLDFVVFLSIAIAIDTGTGIAKAIYLKEFSSRALGSGLSKKIVKYGIALVTVHLISAHTVRGEENPIIESIASYIDATLYTFFLLTEVVSIHENMGIMGLSFLPRWIRVKIERFLKTGKFNPPEE